LAHEQTNSVVEIKKNLKWKMLQSNLLIKTP